jgi:hypothetical protein
MVELRTRKREMRGYGEIIMRNWHLENFVCESIYHPRYSRYEARSGV